MQFQGIRITYFINGGLAILWIYPIIWLFYENFEGLVKEEILLNKELLLAFLIPFIYVIGMLISYLARAVLNSQKRRIQKETYQKYLGDERLYQVPLLIKAASLSKDVYERLEERLTAQLVARGTVLNLLLAIITHTVILLILKKVNLLIIILPILIMFLIPSYFMWKKHQQGYYENQCFAFLHSKGIEILDKNSVKKYKKEKRKKDSTQQSAKRQ